MAEVGSRFGPELASVMEASGIADLNPVQLQAIPTILEGKNVLVVAPTGSGKTEAVMMPVLSRYLKERSKGISILYITPLRALNRDIVKRISQWAEHLKIKVEVRHGDTPPDERRKQAKSPPELLVTTPETLQALLTGRIMREHLSAVRWVIVDEVHALVGNKRGVQLSVGLERLAIAAASDFQRIGLSATLANPEDAARLICGPRSFEVQTTRIPKRYEFGIEHPEPRVGDLDLAQDLFSSPEAAARVRRLKELVESNTSVLIFANARTVVELLGYRLSRLIDVGVHHGSVSRGERASMEDAFKNGRLRALVCTSTLELGIDVGFVDFVVQYLSPMTVSSLVQRFGRSGHRLDRMSKGSILCTTAEQVLESIAVARLFLEGKLEPIRMHGNALDVLAHQLAGLVADGLDLGPKEAFEILRRAHPYRNLDYGDFMGVLNFMESLGTLSRSANRLRKTRATLQYYYENLSMIPDERRYPIVDTSTGGMVGSLGEEFVALHCRTGLDFICRGKVWRIAELGQDGVVYVTPSRYNLGAIPGWDGELPPVPREVAQRAALLRRHMDLLEPGIDVDDAAMSMVEVEMQSERADGMVPDPDEIVLEAFGRYLIVHSCFGTRINRTLLFLLRQLFQGATESPQHGLEIGSNCDAYRIMIEFGRPLRLSLVEERASALRRLKADEVESLVHSEIEGNFPFVLQHIAARFGAIPRGIHLFDPRSRNLEKKYKDTPIYREGIREGSVDQLDVDGAKGLLRAISRNEIRIRCIERSEEEGPTTCARRILDRLAEMPELGYGTSKDEAGKVKNKLMARTVHVRCYDCGTARRARIADLDEHPSCESCGSRFLTIPSGAQERLVLDLKTSGTKVESRDVISKLKWKADLISIYGRKAIMALSVRGIGPQTASRILSKMHEEDEEFVVDLILASGKYEATKRYWAS